MPSKVARGIGECHSDFHQRKREKREEREKRNQEKNDLSRKERKNTMKGCAT